MEKSLKDISWQVTEPEYRADSALSYSTLATYERGGFNSIPTLMDKKESPSLLFGSCVDCILTDGAEAFSEQYVVMDYPEGLSDTLVAIAKTLFDRYHETCRELTDIPDGTIAIVGKELGYYAGDSYKTTRVKKIKESCSTYYKMMYNAGNKTVISSEMYADVIASVNALKSSVATQNMFLTDNPFDGIERCYQIKWKANLEGVDYRCMQDLVIVDHKNKIIIPVDLKTSSHYEWDFYQSFLDWSYQIQARLYYRLLEYNVKKDPYFKDFKIGNYLFVVVNKKTLTPLVWEFPETKARGTLHYGKNQQIELRDPFEIGAELRYYLDNNPKVPKDINMIGKNNLREFLDKM